ncbi:hypothetical protein L7F22_062995 [Adiantum nelumboides]|nr:hypothetical protein [Adiantum nelumboides]
MARDVENPYQELRQLLEGKPTSKKKGHAPHKESPSKERKRGESQDESMEDVAPRRRRAQRSPTPPKWKRSPHSPHCRESKREEKSSRKEERKRSPSSPSSSPSSSSDESSGYASNEKQRRRHRRSYVAWKRSNKLKKFKEGGKNISFLTYDGTFGAIDKVLALIQQSDAAFGGGENKQSKLTGKGMQASIDLMHGRPWERIDHIVMNLPASALNFLDVFRGLLSKEKWKGMMPRVHCYCFMRAHETVADVLKHAEGVLGGSIVNPTVWEVRDVAPNKAMLCLSFDLPEKIVFMKSIKDAECGIPTPLGTQSKIKRPRLEEAKTLTRAKGRLIL